MINVYYEGVLVRIIVKIRISDAEFRLPEYLVHGNKYIWSAAMAQYDITRALLANTHLPRTRSPGCGRETV
jgi:hypothetical protein